MKRYEMKEKICSGKRKKCLPERLKFQAVHSFVRIGKIIVVILFRLLGLMPTLIYDSKIDRQYSVLQNRK